MKYGQDNATPKIAKEWHGHSEIAIRFPFLSYLFTFENVQAVFQGMAARELIRNE